MSKILITRAITGSIHTLAMSPYLPITAAEITSQAIEAAEAGGAILHLHARDPQNGRPSADPDHYQDFLRPIMQSCGSVLNMTAVGSAIMTLEQQLAAPKQVEPEKCSLNMGTMNFALYPMAAHISEWKYDWENHFLKILMIWCSRIPQVILRVF